MTKYIKKSFIFPHTDHFALKLYNYARHNVFDIPSPKGFRRYPARTSYRTVIMGIIDYTAIGLPLSLAILFAVFTSILSSRGIV